MLFKLIEDCHSPYLLNLETGTIILKGPVKIRSMENGNLIERYIQLKRFVEENYVCVDKKKQLYTLPRYI